MIDNLALLVSHGLLLLTVWRLASRPDLDREGGGAEDERPGGFLARGRPPRA